MHFLVNELKINDPPIRNDLVQKLNHHILAGFPSKDQLENIIVKQVSILKLTLHKNTS